MVQGGSTLTQQLAKNLFLSPERTLERKVQEVLLSLWLEQKYTKDQILAMPVLRSAQTGDLYIQIQIETPQKLTKRQRELLQEFEQLSSKENNPESTGFFARMKEFFEG